MDGASLARGLAVRMDNQSMINQELQLYDRAVAANAAKAKENWMTYGDIQFGKAFDPFNQSRLDAHTKDVMQKIADLTAQGRISDDPQKIMQLQQYKRSLIDNEYIDESIAYLAQKNFMQEFISNPNNAEFLDEPEIIEARKQVEFYEATGSIDGNVADRKQFRFTPPPVKINTANIIAKNYAMLEQHGHANWGTGIDGYRQFVTSQDMITAAQNIWDDQSIEGKNIRREWQGMSDEDKLVYKNSPVNWIMSRGKAYVPKDVFHGGRAPSAAEIGGNGTTSNRVDIYKRSIEAPLINAINNGTANPMITTNSLRNTIVAPDGKYDASRVKIYNANGDFEEMNLGPVSGAYESGKARMKTIKGKDGKLAPEQMELELILPMSYDKLRARVGQHAGNIFDEDLIESVGLQVDEMNDVDIEPQYKGIVEKGNGKSKDGSIMMNVRVWVPAPQDLPEKINNRLGTKEKAMSTQYGTEEMDGYTFDLDENGDPIY